MLSHLAPGGRMISRRAALALAGTLVFAGPAVAQSVSSSVAGVVVDQTRQVIRGATVTLTNERTGDARTTITNDVGAFVFAAVQPATYTLRVEFSGFSPFERTHTVVPPNEQLSVGTIQLNVGAVTEAVTTVAV